MKRLFALFMVLVLAFSFTACWQKKLEDVVDESDYEDMVSIDDFQGLYTDFDVDIRGNTIEFKYIISTEYEYLFTEERMQAMENNSLLSIVADAVFRQAEEEGVKGKVTVIVTYQHSNGVNAGQYTFTNK